MLLYHGSPYNTDKIPVHKADVNEIFDGVFCSNERMAAQSHGKYIFTIEIPDKDILTDDDIFALSQNEESAHRLSAAVTKVTGCAEDDENFEIVFEALCFERYDIYDEIWHDLIPYASNTAEIGWELQNLRGKMASALGFSAVTTQDEHGISYLVLPKNTLISEKKIAPSQYKEIITTPVP